MLCRYYYSSLLAVILGTVLQVVASPQEDALARVWAVHVKDPTAHREVIDACQSVMDRASTLGSLLPVARTLAAWHLLASGREADARRIYESALTNDKAAQPLVRYADNMARRWLNRLDRELVVKALNDYYTEHVEYPAKLSQVTALTTLKQSLDKDRFEDPWVYEPGGFSKLRIATTQRYRLYSRNIGPRLSSLKAVSLPNYTTKQAVILDIKRTTPPSVEFAISNGDSPAQRGIATANSLVHGLRFLYIASNERFAIMVDAEGDYWILATLQRRTP